jgi:hypothetical protein
MINSIKIKYYWIVTIIWLLFIFNFFNFFPQLFQTSETFRYFDIAFLILFLLFWELNLKYIKYFKLLFLFLFWIIIIIVYTQISYDQAVKYTIMNSRWYYPYISVIIWYGVFKKIDILKGIRIFFIINIFIIFIYIFFQNILSIDIFRAGYNRVIEIGDVKFVRNLSGYLFTFPFFYFVCQYSIDKKMNNIYFKYSKLYIPLFFIGTILTWTRGIWFVTILSLFYYFIVFTNPSKVIKIFCIFIVIFSLLLFIPPIRGRFFSGVTGLIEISDTFGYRLSYFLERFHVLISEKRFFTGFGFVHPLSKNYPYIFKTGYIFSEGYSPIRTADFEYGNFLFDTGLIGILLFYSYIISLMIRTYRFAKLYPNFYFTPFIVAINVYLFRSFFSGLNSSSYSWSDAGLWALIFAFAEYVIYYYKKRNLDKNILLERSKGA